MKLAFLLVVLMFSDAWAQDVFDVRVVRGPRPAAGPWAVAAPRAADETRAVGLVRARLAHGSFARRLSRLARNVQELESRLGGAAKSPAVAGKLLLVLAMDQPAWGLAPEVGCAAVLEGAGAKLYAVLGGRGLAENDANLAEGLEDAVGQLGTAVRELGFALSYRPAYQDEAWWTVQASTFFEAATPAQALADGAVAAREVNRFRAELARETGDAQLSTGPTAAARAYVPPGNRLLMRLVELAGASDTAELESSEGVREAYGLDWSDPAFERAVEGMPPPALRSPQDMLAVPAFVTGVLADLHAGGLAGARRVKRAIAAGQGLDAVLKELNNPALEQLVARRAHGANLDPGEAAANVRDLRAGKQDGAGFAKRHQRVLAARGAPAAPPALIADDLAQLPLQYMVPPKPITAAGRVRMLAGATTEADAMLKMGQAVQAAHTAQAVETVLGAAPAVEAEPHPSYALEKGVELGLHHGLDDLMESVAAKSMHNKHAFSVAKSSANMVVIEIFVHQIFHHNYGFLGCDADAGTKLQLIAKTLVDFSNWTWGDAVKIAVHAGVYAAATGALVIAGVTGLGVPIIGFLAVLAVDQLIKFAVASMEKIDHRNLTSGIGMMVENWTGPWKRPEGISTMALWGRAVFPSFGNFAWSNFVDSKDDVRERQRLIRERFGTLTKVDSAEYDCAKVAQGELAFTPVNGFTEGALKEWLEYEDAELSEWLHDISDELKDHKEEIDDAQKTLSIVANPLIHEIGVLDVLKMSLVRIPPSRFNDLDDVVPLLAIDRDGRELSAREIADHITFLKFAARMADGNWTFEAASDAEIISVQASYEKRIARLLAETSRLRLLEDHWDAQGEYDEKVARARADVAQAMAEMQEWLRDEAPGILRKGAELADRQARAMVQDMKVDRFERIPEFRAVASFLQARRKSLEVLGPACRRAADALASTPLD